MRNVKKGSDPVRDDQCQEGLKMAQAEGEPAPKTGEPVKRERSDKPMTLAEMTETNKELKAKGLKPMSLDRFPVTPMAQDWLISQKLDDTSVSAFNKRLRFDVLIRHAKYNCKQHTLAETQEMVAGFKKANDETIKRAEQERQLRDVHADDTVEAVILTDGRVTCDIGEEMFEPRSWTAVKDGQVVMDKRSGKPFRNGNFFVLRNEDGTFRVGAIGRCCVKDYRATLASGTDSRLFHSHTYADAIRIKDEMTAEIEEAKAYEQKRRDKLAKLGASVNALGETNRSAKLGFRNESHRGGYRR